MITISLSNFDYDTMVGVFRLSANDISAEISVDYKNHTISDIKWGYGNKLFDKLKQHENNNAKPSMSHPSQHAISHTSQWELAGQWLGALTSPHKMRLFAKASLSKIIEGPVSLPVLDHRRQCCHGVNLAGEKVSEPCVSRYETDTGVYCKTCGCPEYSIADISVDLDKPTKSKLAFPALECPMNKFSAVSGRRREARNAH